MSIKRAVVILFFSFLTLLFLWFAVREILALTTYFRLSASAPAHIEGLKVEKRGTNEYAIVVHFSFIYDNKKMEAFSDLPPLYPNPYAAENRVTQVGKEGGLTVWFNPRKSEKSATLEKVFPTSLTISTFVLLALMLYFFILGRYVLSNASFG